VLRKGGDEELVRVGEGRLSEGGVGVWVVSFLRVSSDLVALQLSWLLAQTRSVMVMSRGV
jgi:hypothetical protein